MQVALDEAKIMGLDDALEYITDDELVEVTPQSIRIRKVRGMTVPPSGSSSSSRSNSS
jgi:predicted membrane GTPase involved in stress response